MLGNAYHKVLVVFGTRPEAIKLAPVILELRNRRNVRVVVCSTGQHRDMIAPVCELFGIDPDYDLDLMRPGQSLTYVAAAITEGLTPILERERPDIALVQGDTTTAFAAALSCFYNKVQVGHVEAGLRTWNTESPWPEEMHRVLVGKMASLHFAPTPGAAENLIRERVDRDDIEITGNTVVDAAKMVADGFDAERSGQLAQLLGLTDPGKPLVLFTMHRRESFGRPVEAVFEAVRRFCAEHEVQLLFPVHPNPNISEPAHRILGDAANVRLCQPLDYEQVVFALSRCRFLITDSGGLVEEAPTFRKPVLVLRENSERRESIDAGGAILCGTNTNKLLRLAEQLLHGGPLFATMSAARNPFGDGKASARIADSLIGSARRQLRAA